ncbi:leucine-rich repeat-containing protein 61 isoform X3 [Equus przewalskii]|uniref:Leucine-rich repeat-containing protein 61 isoform X3 n=1 Tax=Equus przewalskii TaxID=9798 RepID=A0ABM4P6K7_EQUPR
MLEVEKIRKTPKRHSPSGPVGQEPPVCADTLTTRLRGPIATVASPCPELKTRATNTFRGLAWGARVGLPEAEVKLEFVDIEEKTGSGHRKKVRPSGSQKGSEKDLFLQRKRPSPLPRGSLVPSSDQVFLEEQEEGALDLCVCSEKKSSCSLGRLDLQPAASRATCQPSRGPNKPKGDSRLCGLKSVLQQKPLVQPEKKVSKKKAHGQREEREPAGRKWRDPVLSSVQAPSTPALVQAASLHRSEVGQTSANEEARQADILIALLAREVRRLKKWKKRRLLPGVGEKAPLLSLQKPLCLKKLVRTIKAETKGWASPRYSQSPLDSTGQKPTLDVRRFFTVDCKNICRVTCTLCHTSIRQGRNKGQSQTSGLVRHLGPTGP